MIRKFLTACVVVSAIGLSGCAGGAKLDAARVGELVAEVRDIARTTCGFLPIADTVAAILAVGNPALSAAGPIAHAICNAVTAPAAARGERVPTVNGVRVKGKFVSK